MHNISNSIWNQNDQVLIVFPNNKSHCLVFWLASRTKYLKLMETCGFILFQQCTLLYLYVHTFGVVPTQTYTIVTWDTIMCRFATSNHFIITSQQTALFIPGKEYLAFINGISYLCTYMQMAWLGCALRIL